MKFVLDIEVLWIGDIGDPYPGEFIPFDYDQMEVIYT